MVNMFPAMVRLDTRSVVPVLEATVYVIVPLPVPDPELIVTQEAAAEVDQLQPA
jgi:hypothetical protein